MLSLNFESLLWWINYWRLLRHQATHFLLILVSILVVVDQLLEVPAMLVRMRYLSVSILVVVDQLLEDILVNPYESTAYSFNPCCGGSITGGLFVFRKVQTAAQFQSLLWWINYWRRPPVRQPHDPDSVSILVVVDQLLEANQMRPVFVFRRGFNPCCGGSITGGCFAIKPSGAAPGFNPCCGGSITGGVAKWFA